MTTITMTELTSTNPATGEVVGTVPVTPIDTIDEMFQRSHAAQGPWSSLSLDERIDILKRVIPVLGGHAEEIGALITAEMGKPLAEGIGEVQYGVDGMADNLDEIALALGSEEMQDGTTCSTLHRDPFGVCVAITPWNFPFLMVLQIVMPALAAGNTVVMKPSEMVPLTGQAFADAFNEVLPPDVLQIVHGDDTQGKALVAGDCDLIGFTGSRAAGQHILSTAGKDLKRVVLELGGKDPMIVLDDADVEAAASFATRNSFRNCGQVCVSTERIYVEPNIADAFETAVVKKTSELIVGNGADEGVQIGPMVSAEQKAHVLAQLERAKVDGAAVAYGDTPMDGNFVAPTVLTDLSHDMPIMVDETFGPVACIVRVADADEAVRLANDTPYGLGAAVFGHKDAERVARQLTAGMIGVNQGCGGASGTPWVGAGQSGYGYHGGRDGHRQFAQVRVVSRSCD
ncbi:MAG: aldehyde dehydrogenase family protein [Phycisphaerales bacterium]|jgi:succinate-semialdehyde dehydrogenase/glutarate-semialdehyde dehydrogenase|nr:aldehyde dehydrogenase family protein [Phycisphaerales bacterium]MDP7087194.1 aldehyde dehydrogenase family protein [Phycisphaerales bacterium]